MRTLLWLDGLARSFGLRRRGRESFFAAKRDSRPRGLGRRARLGSLTRSLYASCCTLEPLEVRTLLAVVIDSFDTAQIAILDPPGGSSSVAGSGMLGGTRDLAVELLAGAGPATASVSSGAFDFSVADTTPDSRGRVELAWDGDWDPNVLDPDGLGGVDLTAGGASGLRLRVNAADAGTVVSFEIHTDAANSSTASIVLPSVVTPSDFFVGFGQFATAQGAGATFGDVGAVVMTVTGTEVTAEFDLLEAVAPGIEATKSDSLASDVDNDGVADPGDTIEYTVEITNNGGDATGVLFNDTLDPNTTLVPGSIEITPIAFDDAYLNVVGNTRFQATTANAGLLGNDVDPDDLGAALGTDLVVKVGSVAKTGGTVAGTGTLNVAANGTFTYDPPIGETGTEIFEYAVTDSDLLDSVSTGIVTFTISEIVWFVDNTNTGCGTPSCGAGTQVDPFATLKQAETASAANEIIRVREGDGTDTGHDQGFIFKTGQRLVGGAADLVIGGNLIEAGTSHSVHSHAAGNVLDLAGNHIIEGLRLNPTTGHGLAGTGSSNVTADNMIVYTAGAAGGVSLTNHTGGFAFSNSMITSTAGTTGVAVQISGGSGLFDFSGSPISHDGGGLIHVQNTNAATANFTGSNPTLANGTDHGILLSNNIGGSTFTFDAIGDVGTGAGDAVRIAGSGTVNLNTIGNVSATGGAALDVSGTTVVKSGGPGAITFASLASTGGAVGVNLNGVAPAVTVNGTTTINGATGINLQASGAVTFTGQAQVTSTAGAAITANNTGLISVLANTSTADATGGAGIDITTTQLAMTFASLSATPGAGGRGVNLVGATGNLTSAGGAITGGTAGTAFHVDGGAVSATHGGTVTQNNAQRVVNIEDTTGGAVIFNGKVTGGQNSTGVRIHNADGNASFADLDLGTSGARMGSTALTLSGGSAGTFSFADTQIFTDGAIGIDANNGGTVQITGAGNRVTTSNGIAIYMHSGTTIGTNGVTFQRVDASGSTHGIRLNNAGSGFTITGAATTDGSGGTIQNVSQRGIEVLSTNSISLNNLTLTNAASANGPGPCPDAISSGANTGCNAPIHLQEVVGASLINVDINGSAQHGLNGWRVTDLTLNNSTILNAGNEVGENGAKLFNLFGTSTIDGTTIDNSFRDNLRVQNDDNTQLTLTIDNSFFTDSVGGLGVHFSGRGSSRMALMFEDSEVTGNGSSGIQPQGSDDSTASGGSFDFRIHRVVFENNAAAAIDMGALGQSPLYFEIMNNGTAARPITNHASHVINVNQGGSSSAPFTTATVDGIISGNFIGSGPNNSGTTAGSGIRLVENQSGTMRVLIENNTVKGWTEHGIFVIARDGAG